MITMLMIISMILIILIIITCKKKSQNYGFPGETCSILGKLFEIIIKGHVKR